MIAFDLPDRNRLAQKTIGHWAWKHVKQDVGIDVLGTLGGIIVPGAGYAALLASVAAGIPIYQGLARDLQHVYQTRGDEITRRLQTANYVWDAGITIAAGALGATIGADFLTEIAPEVLAELGLGGLVTWIPVVGGAIGAGVGAMIAATMTWRIGTMVSMYYQYGGRWIYGSQYNTWESAKGMPGAELGFGTDDRVNLNDVVDHCSELFEYQVEQAVELAMTVFEAAPMTPLANYRKMIGEKLGFSNKVIEEAMKKIEMEIRRRTRDQ